ncbi:MAG TPA: N-acetyltransferase, partial [bacterium]|nr:N-acetyltransferase [bacterium]
VGMAGYFHELRYKLRHVATIVSVYVQPDTRKQGIARQLMETVLADLTGLGYIRKAKLTVNPCQKEAVALYERLGFTRAGVLKEEMRVGDRFDDHWIMEKQLTTVS